MKLTQTLAAVALTAVASNSFALAVTGSTTGVFSKVAGPAAVVGNNAAANLTGTDCNIDPQKCNGIKWGVALYGEGTQYQLNAAKQKVGASNPNGDGIVRTGQRSSLVYNQTSFNSTLDTAFVFGNVDFTNGEITTASILKKANLVANIVLTSPVPTPPSANPLIESFNLDLVNTQGVGNNDDITLNGGASIYFNSGTKNFKFTFLGAREVGVAGPYIKKFYADEDLPGTSFNLYGKIVAVSEPASVALFGLGLLGLAGARRKKA